VKPEFVELGIMAIKRPTSPEENTPVVETMVLAPDVPVTPALYAVTFTTVLDSDTATFYS